MDTVKTLFKSADNEAGFLRVMINDQDSFDHFTGDGWVQHIDQLQKPEKKKEEAGMDKEERELRDEYEKLTGEKIGGRAKMATIKKMVEEARANASTEG